MDPDVDDRKDEVRRQVWQRLEAEQAVTGSVHGKIPAFVGAEAAADRLADLPAWKAAGVVKANPDRAQLPVRVRALAEGKLLYMAVPRLAGPQPFYLLDPIGLTLPIEEAATAGGAARVARMVGPAEMQSIDIVVSGSVAADARGVRLGKGAGYSDIEIALLQEAGLLSDATVILTTVHGLQVVEGPLPEADHDVRLDLIVTPDEVLSCGPRPRPRGLIWDHLDAEKIAAIPVLAARAPR